MAARPTRRYLHDPIVRDLARKMVFVSGPRQVGKTTLALQVVRARDATHPAYRNWDDVHARASIQRGELPAGQRRIIFDELHKYARWRGLLKGLFDTRAAGVSFLVTGAARLEVYRRGGDSLQGRYHSFRLHPFSLTEAGGDARSLDALLRFGGFPEPLLAASEQHWRRWSRERIDRVVREDVRDTEGYRMELQYLRDTDGREVDFVVLRDRKPLFAVEAKSSEQPLSPATVLPGKDEDTGLVSGSSGKEGRGSRRRADPSLRGALPRAPDSLTGYR